jgi:hypothetical protein
MASPVKMLDVGGIGARKPHIRRLKNLTFAAEGPIEAK